MKILCVICEWNEQVLHMRDVFTALGHRTEFFVTYPYAAHCSYYRKKIDDWGFHGGRDQFVQEKRAEFHEMLRRFAPDVVFSVNLPADILIPEDICAARAQCPVLVFFVDGLQRSTDINVFLPIFSHIFVFEYSDVAYLRDVFGLAASYAPVGYQSVYERVHPTEEKTTDILFIGSPFRNRRILLEELARCAEKKGWTMRVYGPFFETRYFWKQYIFRRRFPHLYRVLTNTMVPPAQAAELYARAKICLNVHDAFHKSPNPRTFDIMATGSFELMDARDYYGDRIAPGRDVAVFEGAEDLKEKVAYYLEHEVEREQIAQNGHRAVCDDGTLSLSAIVARMLESASHS